LNLKQKHPVSNKVRYISFAYSVEIFDSS